MSAGAAAGGIIFLVVIILMGLFVWSYMKGHADTQEAIDKGCTPLTSGWTGIPSTFSCPAGTYLSWDPEHNPK